MHPIKVDQRRSKIWIQKDFQQIIGDQKLKNWVDPSWVSCLGNTQWVFTISDRKNCLDHKSRQLESQSLRKQIQSLMKQLAGWGIKKDAHRSSRSPIMLLTNAFLDCLVWMIVWNFVLDDSSTSTYSGKRAGGSAIAGMQTFRMSTACMSCSCCATNFAILKSVNPTMHLSIPIGSPSYHNGMHTHF